MQKINNIEEVTLQNEYEQYKKYTVKIKDADEIPLNDLKTIKFLARGKNMLGIFQLSTFSTCQYLMEVMPILIRKYEETGFLRSDEVIKQISDITTIIRPSARNSGATERYLARLRGEIVRSPIEGNYFFDMWKKHTSKTQHELLYQEHLMLLLDELLQLNNLGLSDVYRRIFEKGKIEKFAPLKQRFWDLYKTKTSVEQCKQFWQFLILNSGYSFNLSHAVSYSILSFQTAFLKVHCTKYYIAVCINDCKSDQKMKKEQKIERFVQDAQDFGIKVFPPRINNSYPVTTADKKEDNIYLSAHILKGLGENISKYLAEKNDFKSIEEFLTWSNDIYTYSKDETGKEKRHKIFNKTVYEVLTRMRFFDQFNLDRNEVAKVINNFTVSSEPEYREKEFKKTFNGDKKFNNYAYKLKKHEVLYQDYEKVCQVIIRKPLLADPIEVNMSNFKAEMKYLAFPLSDFMLNYDKKIPYYLKEKAGYVIVMGVKQAQKGDYKYTNVTVNWSELNEENPEVIHLPLVHRDFEIGDVLYVEYNFAKKFYINKCERIESLM